MHAANHHLHAENNALQAMINKEKEAVAAASLPNASCKPTGFSGSTAAVVLQMARIIGIETVTLKPTGSLPLILCGVKRWPMMTVSKLSVRLLKLATKLKRITWGSTKA